MRRLLLILALFLLAGCGGKPADPLTKASGSLTAKLATDPKPPRVGHDNNFTVTLTENGAPVTRAQVEIALFFRALNQEGPKAPCIEGDPGSYSAAELSTGMNGSWEAEVKVQREGQPDANFTFPFRVAR